MIAQQDRPANSMRCANRFVREALQDPELMAKYVKSSNATHPPVPRKDRWPPPEQLQKCALDPQQLST